ncbi:hypothetical protein GE09DRAFT_167384 [Coniochaeta sp. 2T2.1]|nr:hypothetical protein GE09DRAFT_167384 [Coniochaeta sp. 2T2.1]
MKLSYGFVVATQLLAVLALPSPNKIGDNGATTTTTSAAAARTTAAAAEEGAAENEVELTGQFAAKINLGGNNVKTDVVFPGGQNGALEVEFQNQQGRVLTVTENTTPPAAPAGFTALEPVSYVVALEGGGEGLTLAKIDYIRNANNTLDISKGVLGVLCKETKTFAIAAETEFEADEFELTAPVANLAGEFAFFLPNDAAAAAGGAGEAAAGGATGGAATQPSAAELLQQLVDLLKAAK